MEAPDRGQSGLGKRGRDLNVGTPGQPRPKAPRRKSQPRTTAQCLSLTKENRGDNKGGAIASDVFPAEVWENIIERAICQQEHRNARVAEALSRTSAELRDIAVDVWTKASRRLKVDPVHDVNPFDEHTKSIVCEAGGGKTVTLFQDSQYGPMAVRLVVDMEPRGALRATSIALSIMYAFGKPARDGPKPPHKSANRDCAWRREVFRDGLDLRDSGPATMADAIIRTEVTVDNKLSAIYRSIDGSSTTLREIRFEIVVVGYLPNEYPTNGQKFRVRAIVVLDTYHDGKRYEESHRIDWESEDRTGQIQSDAKSTPVTVKHSASAWDYSMLKRDWDPIDIGPIVRYDRPALTAFYINAGTGDAIRSRGFPRPSVGHAVLPMPGPIDIGGVPTSAPAPPVPSGNGALVPVVYKMDDDEVRRCAVYNTACEALVVAMAGLMDSRVLVFIHGVDPRTNSFVDPTPVRKPGRRRPPSAARFFGRTFVRYHG